MVVAAPGAGKTTRVPPALIEDGPVLLLQPRRVAARSIARRIAEERGWTLGGEVGWHVRFDRRFGADTRLLVATEGVLTARLQQDPLLSTFRTIVIDEFHERSVHADVGLALAKQAWRARDDLRIVVMSATIDAQAVAAFLDGCPIVDVPGRLFDLDVRYRPDVPIEDAAADLVRETNGAVLCFLPGAPEIRRAAERLAPKIADRPVPIVPLHGGLDADTQDAAIAPSRGPRVILATNLAETTVTVPDVRAVVDGGFHKVARYDPARAIDSLELERISQDSADQRAGRAGRVQAGIAVRLWDPRLRLDAHREPEIARVDLASVALDVIAWGGDPRSLGWFEPPPAHALDAAIALLSRLGAIDAAGSVTSIGRALQRLPLHPRLGRFLLAAHGSTQAALACALLSDRHVVPARHRATPCDLLAATDDPRALPPHVAAVARDLREAARAALDRPAADRVDDETWRRAVLAGYPDRVAQRRSLHGDRVRLASGAGARLARESGVHDGEFFIAVDVAATPAAMHRPAAPGATDDALVRIATRVEREWLTPTSRERRHEIGGDGRARAFWVDRYDALVLDETDAPVDPIVAEEMEAEARRRRAPSEADLRIRNRRAFAAGVTPDAAHAAAIDGALSIASRPSRSRCRAAAPRASTIATTAASWPQ